MNKHQKFNPGLKTGSPSVLGASSPVDKGLMVSMIEQIIVAMEATKLYPANCHFTSSDSQNLEGKHSIDLDIKGVLEEFKQLVMVKAQMSLVNKEEKLQTEKSLPEASGAQKETTAELKSCSSQQLEDVKPVAESTAVIHCIFNDIMAKAKFDSGSPVCVMSQTWKDLYMTNVATRSISEFGKEIVDLELISLTGHPLPLDGWIPITINLQQGSEEFSVKVPFLISDSLSSVHPLIGMNVVEKLMERQLVGLPGRHSAATSLSSKQAELHPDSRADPGARESSQQGTLDKRQDFFPGLKIRDVPRRAMENHREFVIAVMKVLVLKMQSIQGNTASLTSPDSQKLQKEEQIDVEMRDLSKRFKQLVIAKVKSCSSDEKQEEVRPEGEVATICPLGEKNQIDCTFNNIAIKVLLDSGSPVCLMSQTWKNLNIPNVATRSISEYDKEISRLCLKSATGHPIEFESWIPTILNLRQGSEEVSIKVPFLISHSVTSVHPLIGLNVVEKLMQGKPDDLIQTVISLLYCHRLRSIQAELHPDSRADPGARESSQQGTLE